MSQLRYGPRPVADTTDGKVPNREVAATKIGAWSTSLTATFLTDPEVIAAVVNGAGPNAKDDLEFKVGQAKMVKDCLLYTSPSPRD